MEYGIAIGIILLFFIMYICTRPKMREHHFKTFKEEEYNQKSVEFLKNMALPKEGCAVLPSKKYCKLIKKTLKLPEKKKKTNIIFEFEPEIKSNKKEIEQALKIDFAPLSSLPCVDKEPRIVKIARFSLAHTKYIFTDDKVSYILDEQNKIKTLTINEVLNLRLAFEFVLIEKLAFLSQNIKMLLKLEKLAEKFAKSSDTFDNTPIYNSIKENKLFLEMCAEHKDYETRTFFESYLQTIQDAKFYLGNVFLSFESINLYEFNKFYSPSKILCTFDNFNKASNDCKTNFMKTLSNFASKENLDEYKFVERLEGYAKTANKIFKDINRPSFVAKSKKIILGNRLYVFSKPKLDDKMLATALWSKEYMNIYFSENPKKNAKSVIKNNIIDNTFMPYYENNTINLGIAVKNNLLTVTPHLPESVSSVAINFKHNNTSHHLIINNSTEEKIKLGGTVLHGVTSVLLKDIPLEIEIDKNFKEWIADFFYNIFLVLYFSYFII